MSYNCDDYLRLFKSEYRVFNLKMEYPNYKGDEEWAVASLLPEDELRSKYADELTSYEPFIYLSAEMVLPIVRFHSNDRKFALRNAKYGDLFPYEDGTFEKYHPEMIVDPFEQNMKWAELHDAIDNLPAAQKERIKKHFFEGETFVDIASAEGVSPQAVQQSIARSLAALKKYLKAVDNSTTSFPNQ